MQLWLVLLVRLLRQLAYDARRKARRARYALYAALAGVVDAIALVVVLLPSILCLLEGWYVLALILGVTTPLIHLGGPLFARRICAPRGWVRIARFCASLGHIGRDAQAYSLAVAATAARSSDAAAWVERLRETRRPLGDGEIAATAFLAANRGDDATARELLRSLAMIAENHASVRELAGEWLACDAAERGAWTELLVGHATDERTAAALAEWPVTPLTFLLLGIAARHAGAAGAPSRRELWARWLMAPHREATLPLVHAALRAKAGTATPATGSPAVGGPVAADDATPSPSLSRAVAALLAFDAAPPTAARLADAVHAWDAALADPETHAWLGTRALELEAPLGAVDRALRELAADVAATLGQAADRAQLPAPTARGPVGDALARHARHGRLDALEAAFARWGDRRQTWKSRAPEHRAATRAPIDEWREFVALHAAYRAAVAAGGLSLRRLAFPHAFSVGTNMAAWLWNQFKEYSISNAISQWLLEEAIAVGDAEAIELGHRNCSLEVPTRTGRVQPTPGN